MQPLKTRATRAAKNSWQ